MSSPQKIKGSKWERDAAKDLSENGGEWKRIPGSGSLGTNLGMSNLTGDLHGSYPWFKKQFKAEGKVGYGTSKQITLKREWFTQIRDQAKLNNNYPCVLFKFDDVTGGDRGSAKVISFNIDTWNQMMGDMNEIYEHYLKYVQMEYDSRIPLKEDKNAES